MKILWLNWKDKKNPNAGGAETVNEELIRRLARDGNEVILLTAGFPGAEAEETIDGYKVIRVGGRWSVYWRAYKYYQGNLQGWADLVIDEVNTIPFFAKFYVKEKNILFFHQLCREIWFYQMFFPLNVIGYVAETIYLRLLNDRKAIAVSASTKKDLARFGFREENIGIIGEGIELAPIKSLEQIKKFDKPTVLSLGCIREMKRTDHIVKAFEIAKGKIKDLRLVAAGGAAGGYGRKVRGAMKNSKFKNDIEYLGKVSGEKKVELMQKSHLIAVASVKEGWGLIVTEANSQGTPAVVYNVDGLRDAVIDRQTGLTTKENTPQGLADRITELLQNPQLYKKLQTQSHNWSKQLTFEKSYQDLLKLLSFD